MARIVVAGAGVVGASIAYHLALLGARAVTLADRGELASGALVRRAVERGVDVRERIDARELRGDVLVVAAGAASPQLCPDLPIRPLCRQLVDVGPVPRLPRDLPMTIEEETTFHFRRRGE